MSKTIINIVLFIFIIVASFIVSISAQMQREIHGTIKDSIYYLIFFFLALAYTQWYIRRFLSPLQRMEKEERGRIKNLMGQKYKKGFFAGTIGLGYLLAVLYGFSLLYPKLSENTPNFALGAIFFILVGTIAQARDLTSTLVDDLIKKNQKNIEQPPAGDVLTSAPEE